MQRRINQAKRQIKEQIDKALEEMEREFRTIQSHIPLRPSVRRCGMEDLEFMKHLENHNTLGAS